jgi:hypothetical protein
MMNTNNPIDLLEKALNECCDKNNSCMGCRCLASCVSLWDKATEQFAVKHLKPIKEDYLAAFEKIRGEERVVSLEKQAICISTSA